MSKSDTCIFKLQHALVEFMLSKFEYMPQNEWMQRDRQADRQTDRQTDTELIHIHFPLSDK